VAQSKTDLAKLHAKYNKNNASTTCSHSPGLIIDYKHPVVLDPAPFLQHQAAWHIHLIQLSILDCNWMRALAARSYKMDVMKKLYAVALMQIFYVNLMS
jgi:hypothetical protein